MLPGAADLAPGGLSSAIGIGAIALRNERRCDVTIAQWYIESWVMMDGSTNRTGIRAGPQVRSTAILRRARMWPVERDR
jgi:hypothetical protein